MVELMTVLVIFGLVLAAAIPSVSTYIRRDQVRMAALGFRSTCMVAQKRAMATRIPHRVVYEPASGTYYIERRESGDWTFASSDTVRIPDHLGMDGGTIGDATNHIITFEALGTVEVDDVPARVQFYNESADTSTVTLVRTGRMTVSES
jgi:Tfp pilus assembly protein FimT